MTEQVLSQNSREYKNLKLVADILSLFDDDIQYQLGDVFLDYGSNWMWTTIIKINLKESGILRSCQAINSREWKQIVAAESKSDLLDIVKSIIK